MVPCWGDGGEGEGLGMRGDGEGVGEETREEVEEGWKVRMEVGKG